ncbi:MAG: TerB family tellurite resistance protein [Flavobacteriales bacterium]|nr:TerB family tellurite resistance protein [Flavobacteriales bacterium]MBV6485235.1 Co-chaperone protein DjlA [Flavobacteriales bacterium]MBX2959358.1 TerB family tellurite resistance protein [Flavobacteriales bacterium]MCL4857309.1 TerB family tellurite resistance protein [Flavobacteriales bacterium]HRP60185.1 TerB family tellurite resistance protein [Vicingus sp.]
MAKFGKWLGGGLGWAFGGPIGAILGFAVGSAIDSVVTVEGSVINNQSNKRKANDFSLSLLVLIAAVMKADGKVLKSELDYVKNFFLKQFGSEHTQELLITLREILKKDIPIQEVCLQIKTYTLYPARLQLIHLLFGVASVDGQVQQDELNVIKIIAGNLGIKPNDFASIKAMFFKEVDGDYKILEIEKSVSDEEVKKAYRRMAVKYHPDKVSHLGEEFQKSAKEKFQKVQEAYENIKKQRGMN